MLELTAGENFFKAFLDEEKGRIEFLYKNKKVYEFSIIPAIKIKGAEKTYTGGELLSLEQKGEASFEISYCDDLFKKTACVKFTDGCIKYFCRISSNTEARIDELSYGGDELINMENNGLVTGELFCWAPDINRTLIPRKGTQSVGLSSYEIRDMNFIKGDGGRFIIPPYVAAINCGEAWLGIGTVEIPNSKQGLQPVIENRSIRFKFEFNGNLICGRDKSVETPAVILYLTENTDMVIKKYTDYLFDRGVAKQPQQWEDWWGGPLYCTIGDQIYEAMMESGIPSEVGCENFINTGFTDEMVNILVNRNIACTMLVFDAGWMRNMALFDLHEERFPDFRNYMGKLRQKGIRSILWIAPYHTEFFMTGRCEYIYNNHKDWYVRDWDDNIIPLLDYTHPGVRDFMRSRVEYMLSDKPGCLNADGFKVDFYYHIPDPGMKFHDPSWGTGELMQYKVLKLIYDAAKEAKKEAFIECSSANPLFNDVQDACRLNDDVTNSLSTYEKRAWITVQSRCNIPDTDDWWSFKDYFVQLTLEKCIFGIPALYAVKYRGEQGHLLLGYSGVAPGGNPVNISDEDYRRVSTITRVYANCPVNLEQDRQIDLKGKNYSRVYNKGRLKSFYSALGLNFNTVLATFNEKSALVCSIADSRLSLPVSQIMYDFRVYRVCKGEEQLIGFDSSGSSIAFNVEDCGKEGVYYNVQYGLK